MYLSCCVFSLLCSRRVRTQRRSPWIYLASREAEVRTRATERIDTDSPYPRYLRVAGSTSERCLLSSAPRRRSRTTPAPIAVIYGVDVAAIGRFRSAADEDFETSRKIGRGKPACDRKSLYEASNERVQNHVGWECEHAKRTCFPVFD